LSARDARTGTYAVTSRATKDSTSGIATASFVVQ
jgi:hypothetical protein